MPHFVLTCLDKPGALENRMATREAHLAYVAKHKDKVKLGGPLLDGEGNMNGSLIILEVEDRAAAEAFTRDDPYTTAGVFGSVDIRGVRLALGQP